ncbi:hypothetical protein CEXT_638021 [Caerostris extrusa]|uniref:Uncharacterized protein n=1 Tax=Caerostris extrusa TaxID=172846 RepID=A0AAV4NM45_CAEEX|nr:hypothetical protein CEXT_638021 [Caerostris extrusa]
MQSVWLTQYCPLHQMGNLILIDDVPATSGFLNYRKVIVYSELQMNHSCEMHTTALFASTPPYAQNFSAISFWFGDKGQIRFRIKVRNESVTVGNIMAMAHRV